MAQSGAASHESEPAHGTARLSIFLGKGGVGKTTLAAAVALDRARAGERVLLVSPTSTRDLGERLKNEGDGGSGNLDYRPVDPRGLVDDVFRRILKFGPMGELVLRHPSYDSFVDVAPGMRELAFLNYVYNAQTSGTYDRVIVDGPATGHGLHFLEAPERAKRILVGRLGERAGAIMDLLRDHAATEVVLVTIPEEMPVREAMDLATRLESLEISLDNIVVNKWLPDVFTDEASARVLDVLRTDTEARRSLARAIAPHSRIDVDDWVAALHVIRSQREESEAYLADLRRAGSKLHIVPYVTQTKGRLTAISSQLAGSVEDAEVTA